MSILQKVEKHLRKEGIFDIKDRRCVSICSAGLDSTIAACVMRYFGFNVTLMHFNYGQKPQESELNRIHKIAERLGVSLELVDTPFIGQLGGSPLTDKDMAVPEGQEAAETILRWVPARNTFFLAHALAFCDCFGTPVITMGLNKSERNYSDQDPAFLKLFNKLAEFGAKNKTTLVAPCIGLTKTQEILLMKELEMLEILSLTWSCDFSERNEKGELVHDGRCGCCLMRRWAFYQAGVQDFQPYLDEDYFLESVLPKLKETGGWVTETSKGTKR